MSTEANPANAEGNKQAPNVLAEIERNGVVIPFVETEIKRAGADVKGTKYPSPDRKWLARNLDKLVKFLGEDEVAGIVASKFKLWCQEWYWEAFDKDTEVFDIAKFTQSVVEMSARGETIPDLRKRLEELTLELGDIDIDPENPSPEDFKLMMKIRGEIKRVNSAINDKKRKPAQELATA